MTDLLHLSHLYLESLDLGVQLLEPAQVCLSKSSHLLQGRVPDHGQPVLVRLLAVVRQGVRHGGTVGTAQAAR